jgi:hypothetical protein
MADDAVLAERIRDPMVEIEEVRLHAARRSTSGLFVAAGVEVVAGLIVEAGADDEAARGAGALLLGGGVAHAAGGWLQLGLADRRHAAFMADLAAAEGRPEAFPSLARDLRLDLERDARGHAFAAGAYAGVLGAAALSLALSEDLEAPIALVAVGGTGLTNHVMRWRTATRLSVDLDTVPQAVPGPFVQ